MTPVASHSVRHRPASGHEVEQATDSRSPQPSRSPGNALRLLSTACQEGRKATSASSNWTPGPRRQIRADKGHIRGHLPECRRGSCPDPFLPGSPLSCRRPSPPGRTPQRRGTRRSARFPSARPPRPWPDPRGQRAASSPRTISLPHRIFSLPRLCSTLGVTGFDLVTLKKT